MSLKPLSFENGEFTTIPDGELDSAVLGADVVTTDGAHPFVAPQGGVDAIADTDLATLLDVKTNAGSKVWQAPVLGLVASLPGSPALDDRYILTTTKQINQWDGAAWVTYTPAAGWVTWVISISSYYWYSTVDVDWEDISNRVDHFQLGNIQGGVFGEFYHLTASSHALISDSLGSRLALITPDGGGVVAARALTTDDVASGIWPAAQGGLGVDASAVDGYTFWTAGSVSFLTAIPYTDLSDVPLVFTPDLHAITHESGGTDELALDGTQITSGVVGPEFGGTGLDGSALTSRLFLASPTSGTGTWSARAIGPDDVGGASGALQVLRRNAGNTANEWAVPDANYPTIEWEAVPIGTRQNLNFSGDGITSVVDNTTDTVTVIIPGPGLSGIVAAIVLG